MTLVTGMVTGCILAQRLQRAVTARRQVARCQLSSQKSVVAYFTVVGWDNIIRFIMA